MKQTMMKMAIAAGIGLVFAGHAGAQANEGWSFEISPYAWLSGMSGTLTVRGNDVDFDKSPEDMLDYVDIAGSLETIIRYNQFVVDATVDYFDLSTDELDVNDQPDNGTLDTEMLLGEIIGGIQLAAGKHTTCDTMVGIRYLGIENELKVDLTGNTHKRDNDIVDPIVMIRPSFAILPERIDGLRVNVTAAVGGGGDSDLIYEIFPELRWQIGDRFLIRGGYRLAGWDFEGSGDNELDIEISGLVAGIGVLF